ncbi:MAG: transcription termination factor NusA [Oscillospiraceae bacterium]|jgi:N utilization substance protein A|nr:transcription termination factor NusA [Oscillospiraceae bacterium]
MSNDLLNALSALNKDKGISIDYMAEKIARAVSVTCKNMYNLEDDEPLVNFDINTGELTVKIVKSVVESVEISALQIDLSEAKNIDPEAEIGGTVEVSLDTKQFGRIAAQTARNIIRQGIHDGERELITKRLQGYEGEIVSSQVARINPRTGAIVLRIGECETSLPRSENNLVPGIKEGDYLKVYIIRVGAGERSPWISVSRSCPEFLKKLFETEIPEILDGVVSIKSIAREACSRSKIAVDSSDSAVDPVGACIGSHGSRIKEIAKELGDERIDIVRYYEDLEQFAESAISPAKAVSSALLPKKEGEQLSCCVTVPDNQISLAIGSKGQNVRLASKLTGLKIDLRPESGYYGEE